MTWLGPSRMPYQPIWAGIATDQAFIGYGEVDLDAMLTWKDPLRYRS
ncbi:predicted protein [Plenodomus lingam JN3]|uniref:Uncharacterized protein n=1 Tax=Leptosphaeria maculans (strain JN3 / isolate v23.1.3 / race Av1-4-5-6-7-8) TaxID=985895 RepID=E5A7M8_LEPMJ|nr:predicted protein [Plenodomus lingam JN3]CBX99623.1 predicted protein [Plenodomus lingam JN3]